MPDRIEKLYDRWSRGGVDEDDIHCLIDELLIQAKLVQDEEGNTIMDVVAAIDADAIHEQRIAVLDTPADLAAIEPDEPEYTGPWHVVRYLVTREFGGSEEGGWYYDWYDQPDLQATFPTSESLAQEFRDLLNEGAKGDRIADGRPQGRHSVLGGVDEVYVVEKTVGESKSTEAPRYE